MYVERSTYICVRVLFRVFRVFLFVFCPLIERKRIEANTQTALIIDKSLAINLSNALWLLRELSGFIHGARTDANLHSLH